MLRVEFWRWESRIGNAGNFGSCRGAFQPRQIILEKFRIVDRTRRILAAPKLQKREMSRNRARMNPSKFFLAEPLQPFPNQQWNAAAHFFGHVFFRGQSSASWDLSFVLERGLAGATEYLSDHASLRPIYCLFEIVERSLYFFRNQHVFKNSGTFACFSSKIFLDNVCCRMIAR